VCGQGEELLADTSPGDAFAGWLNALSGYLVTKRGLSKALIDALGVESELISTCWVAMRETTERLLANAQQDGKIRMDVTAMDVMRLVHGVVVGTERAPEQADRLLGIVLDGLRPPPAPQPE